MANDDDPKSIPQRSPEAVAAFEEFWRKQPKVTFKVQLPKETLDLLRDLSLARGLTDLAASVKINAKGAGYRQPSISKVIAQMVEERRTALEREVEIVRGVSKPKVKVVEETDEKSRK